MDKICIENFNMYENSEEFLQSQLNILNKEIVKVKCELKNNQSENDSEFMQLQINALNQNCQSILKKMECKNNQYQQLISEIDDLRLLLGTHEDTMTTVTNKECHKCVIYREIDKIYQFKIDKDINLAFLTMVGGGGAGGIGFVKGMYYYSAGGGGAGACYIKKPIEVQKGAIINIKVGKGGCITNNTNGEDSYVEIIHINGKKEVIIANGGKNGFPSMILDDAIKGGDGGESINHCLSGNSGNPGKISIPSRYVAMGGDGASSHFYKGGAGGGNYFAKGGNGGNESIILGLDGSFGSGGGGSAPRMQLNMEEILSGNGGNGMVMIEWC